MSESISSTSTTPTEFDSPALPDDIPLPPSSSPRAPTYHSDRYTPVDYEKERPRIPEINEMFLMSGNNEFEGFTEAERHYCRQIFSPLMVWMVENFDSIPNADDSCSDRRPVATYVKKFLFLTGEASNPSRDEIVMKKDTQMKRLTQWMKAIVREFFSRDVPETHCIKKEGQRVHFFTLQPRADVWTRVTKYSYEELLGLSFDLKRPLQPSSTVNLPRDTFKHLMGHRRSNKIQKVLVRSLTRQNRALRQEMREQKTTIDQLVGKLPHPSAFIPSMLGLSLTRVGELVASSVS